MSSVVSIEDFEISDIAGIGAYARVFRAIDLYTKKQVAIKQIPKNPNLVEAEIEMINRERQIYRTLNHPLISQYLYDFEDDANWYIVMEYVSNGSLLDYINSKGKLMENECQYIFAQLVDVMLYLHNECNIVHRDMKVENILLDYNRYVKLIDFGFSTNKSEDTFFSTLCGSPAYIAPEMVKGPKYSKAADIWSMGIILYGMAVGTLPFVDENIVRQTQKIVYMPAIVPPDVSSSIRELIQGMLAKDPLKRLTLEQIADHPWVAKDLSYSQYATGHVRSRSMIDQNLFGMITHDKDEQSKLMEDLLSDNKSRLAASYMLIKTELNSYEYSNAYRLCSQPKRGINVNNSLDVLSVFKPKSIPPLPRGINTNIRRKSIVTHGTKLVRVNSNKLSSSHTPSTIIIPRSKRAESTMRYPSHLAQSD